MPLSQSWVDTSTSIINRFPSIIKLIDIPKIGTKICTVDSCSIVSDKIKAQNEDPILHCLIHKYVTTCLIWNQLLFAIMISSWYMDHQSNLAGLVSAEHGSVYLPHSTYDAELQLRSTLDSSFSNSSNSSHHANPLSCVLSF